MKKKEEAPKGVTPQPGQITGRRIGMNFLATIDGEKYSAKLSEEDIAAVKKRIELFNKKNTESGRKAIIKLLTQETAKKVAAKEKLKIKEKGLKKLAKKNIKEAKVKSFDKETKSLIHDVERALLAQEITEQELEALLRKLKGLEAKVPVAQYTKNPRRGEVYRNGRYTNTWVAEDGREVTSDGYLVVDPINN